STLDEIAFRRVLVVGISNSWRPFRYSGFTRHPSSRGDPLGLSYERKDISKVKSFSTSICQSPGITVQPPETNPSTAKPCDLRKPASRLRQYATWLGLGSRRFAPSRP